MNCRGCGGANREGARFCSFCGAVLTLTCPSCGTDLFEGARFCDTCGSPVGVEPAAEPVVAARKVVTVLFADMTGSTSLEEEMDAETVRSLVDRFYAALRAEVDKRGGRVVKFTGDGLMAAFGVPEVHEDDAARAIEAALAMCRACQELATQTGHSSISLKVGVNTGEVVVIEDDDDVVGDAVNVAARLEGASQAGEVLVGERTWRLTRATASYEPVEPLVLKGKSEPVPAYRLISVDEEIVDTLAAPFVGRDAELEKLLSVFDEAVAANSARLVMIVGSPGLGKTRLARELAARLADRAVVRETRCDPAGSATFAPIAETLRDAASIADTAEEAEIVASLAALVPEDDPERDRIASRAAAILGAGQPGSTEETFWALRRLIETAAREQPRVLVLDDLHWAEPMLLDLVEHLAEWIRDAPVLLVGTGRPELRDVRPSLCEGGRAAAVIALEGLDESATARLAVGLLGTEEVPSELLAKIPASTEGNPLFVREFVRMLVDDGVLRRDGDAWNVTVDVEAIEVPPTIQSLLAARMDRLRSDERTVIELASVIGKEFYRGVLDELAPTAVREQLDTCLESLRRKELVEPAGTYWIDEPVYRFHHALIRDAAYRRLLKESRADLHERAAGWIERKTGGVVGEHEEVIGYHLEQAHEYQRQLGRLDDRAVEIGQRAADLLGAAAQRALDRDDLPAAAALSGRALDRLAADDERRSALLLVRCEALLSMGDVASGAAAVAELERVADAPRLFAWATCFAGQLSNYTEPERLRETEKRVAAAAAELTALGDPAGAAKAHTVHGSTLARLGRFAECETALDAALTAAREANDRRRITAVLGSAPLAALWGPNPVSRAGGRCLDLVRLSRITTGSPGVEVTSTRCQAVLEAFRGRADAARRMLRSARSTLEELGLRHELLETEQFSGIVELVAGDAAAAEPHLRSAHDGFRFVGVDVLAAQTAALLARAHLQLGEMDEAERFAEESEQLGGQDLKASIAWRAVRAEILARRGEFDEARSLAESAVELASRTDALIDHGDACCALSEVCAAAGDRDGARSASERAFALVERKGATALTERAASSSSVAAADARSPDRPDLPSALVNASTRLNDRVGDCFVTRDWPGLDEIIAEDALFDDRRKGLSHSGRGPAAFVESLKPAAETGTARFDSVPLAIRGERLSLIRMTARGRGGPAALETEFLSVQELNADGRLEAMVNFDPDDLDVAMAELDDRFLSGEGAVHAEIVRVWTRYSRAYNSRDWEAMRDLASDDFVLLDERPASLGRLEGVDEYWRAMKELIELIPGRRGVISSLPILGSHGGVATFELLGATADGAETSETMHLIGAISSGSLTRMYIYPAEQLDAAIARFEELSVGIPSGVLLENACTRLTQRIGEHFERREWDALNALVADDVRHEDRRRGLRDRRAGKGSPDLTSIGATRTEGSVVAVRGERLGLVRLVFKGDEDSPGAPEAESLFLSELNEEGLLGTRIIFDPDDLDGAMAELDERFIAAENASNVETLRVITRFARSWTAGDWEDARELLADDFVIVDHRPASLGEIRSPDAYIDQAKELKRLVPYRADVVAYRRLEPDRVVCEVRFSGETAEGAAVESVFQLVVRIREGRIVRMEPFPVDQLAAALARFEELSGGAAAPASAPTNKATSVASRLSELFAIRDWQGLASLFSEGAVGDDRRSLVSDSVVGREAVTALLQSVADIGTVSIVWEPIATRGQRLALTRVVMRGREIGSTAFGMELLQVLETDEQSVFCRAISFDPEDLELAMAELDKRYIDGEGGPVAGIWRAVVDGQDAFNKRDWVRMNAYAAPGLEIVDRRPASFGAVGVDEVVPYMRSGMEVTPDGRLFAVAIHAINTSGVVYQQVIDGTTSEGTPVEISFHHLANFTDGKVTRMEMFPLDQLDGALTRFRQLTESAASIPPPKNLASRVLRRLIDRMLAQDWDGVASLHAEGCRWEDRRPGLQSATEGRQAVVEHVQVMSEGASDWTLNELATRGDRLVLVHGEITVGSFVIDIVGLCEVDSTGLITFTASFDPDDRDAALAELEARYLAAEGRGQGLTNGSVVAFDRTTVASEARDWGELGSLIADDVVIEDRRPGIGFDYVGRDAVVDAAVALDSVSARVLARNVTAIRGDRLALMRLLVGSRVPDAGFEAEVVVLSEIDENGRLRRRSIFDPTDIDAAFAELDERFIFGEGASFADIIRRNVMTVGAINARDWAAYGGSVTRDFVLVDHRPASLGELRIDDLVEAHKVLVDLVPDLRVDVVTYHALDRDRAVSEITAQGHTVDGDPLDLSFVNVLQLKGGRVARTEFFPMERLADALARFEELGGTHGDGSENACTRVHLRVKQAFEERRWDSYPELIADDILLESRRQGLGDVRRGRQAHLDGMRATASIGVTRTDDATLATRGDRLALFSRTWRGDYQPQADEFQVRTLDVWELDSDGRVCGVVTFDPEELDAAFAELDERFAAGKDGRQAQLIRLVSRLVQAINERDWVGVEQTLAGDLVLIDHRPVSLGELSGPQEWISSLKALVEVMPDLRSSITSYQALAPDLAVIASLSEANTPEGEMIELAWQALCQVRDGRISRFEFFPIDRLDDALARFEELGRDDTRRRGGPENAAFQAGTAAMDFIVDGDWDAFKEAHSPTVRLEDRRLGLRWEGSGVDALLDRAREHSVAYGRILTTGIATRGIRLALGQQMLTSRGSEAWESERLVLYEIDEDERILFIAFFDPTDADAALDELDERYLSGTEVTESARLGIESLRAYNRRDWGGYLSLLSEDFVFVDHRPAGRGTVRGGEAYVALTRGMVELVPDVRMRIPSVLREEGPIILAETLSRGTDEYGNPIEFVNLVLLRSVAARISNLEFFAPEELTHAASRFEVLLAEI